MNERLQTRRENDWNDEENFLRLNKKKCEDLLSYLKWAKESYRSNKCEVVASEFLVAIKRAKFLVEESSHNKWLLKALELWDCSQHFFEVFMDLFWCARIMSLHGVSNTCKQLDSWVEEQENKLYSQRYIEELLKAYSDDKKTLEAMVKTTIQEKILREGDPDHQLALLLEDRLNDQNMRHPRLFTSFVFCIRSRIALLSKSSSKTGQHGVVLRFPWVYGKQFAVKMRQPNTDTGEDMFKHEYNILDKYRSPYIVGVVGYWEVQSWLDRLFQTTLCPFLLMEALECDFEGLISQYKDLCTEKPPGFSALDTIKLMLPVAKALRFLHSKDVAHRDIKPQNIMCSNTTGDFDDAVVKLIDFGEATTNASTISPDDIGIKGTYGYMDPAMWALDPDARKRKKNPEGYDLLRADVFSFAMIFVELLTWRSPWEEDSIQRGREVQNKLCLGERPPLPNGLSDYVSFIVECCWCADPPTRPKFKDICSMLQNAKLLLLDENFFGDREGLFCYQDATCVDRSIANRAFL